MVKSNSLFGRTNNTPLLLVWQDRMQASLNNETLSTICAVYYLDVFLCEIRDHELVYGTVLAKVLLITSLWTVGRD
jgi:hypothetical protein